MFLYALYSYFIKEGIEQLLVVFVSFLSVVTAVSFLLIPTVTPIRIRIIFYTTAILLVFTSLLAVLNPIFILSFWKFVILMSLFHFVGILVVKFQLEKGKFWQYILIFNSLFYLGMFIGIVTNINSTLYFTTVGSFFLAASISIVVNLLLKIKSHFNHLFS